MGLLGDQIQWDSGGGRAGFEGLIRWLLSRLWRICPWSWLRWMVSLLLGMLI